MRSSCHMCASHTRRRHACRMRGPGMRVALDCICICATVTEGQLHDTRITTPPDHTQHLGWGLCSRRLPAAIPAAFPGAHPDRVWDALAAAAQPIPDGGGFPAARGSPLSHPGGPKQACQAGEGRLITSHRIASHRIASHHITSHHITSHHITSHHITSHHITSHHITPRHVTPHLDSCSDQLHTVRWSEL